MKSVAVVAHDQKKDEMVSWVKENEGILQTKRVFATGTTGGRISKETSLTVNCLKSGPLGGDAQLGAMIAEDQLDALIFFIDPLSALPHDVDVKSLLRLAILYNTPLAVNEASATAILKFS